MQFSQFTNSMLGGLMVSLFIFSAFVTDNVNGKVSRLVNITQGPVRGYEDFNGVIAFYGIPYATTPTGLHKFQAPLPPPTWSEPFEAVDKEIACPQLPYLLPKPYHMEQECLVVNVYVPDTEETNLPVVIYVHGGGFFSYFGNFHTPSNAVRSENVIVVTFNYRLGIHGFLCLGTKGAPGNAALKDQLAALKWVNRNIAAFGGDPNNVTIDGYSAGTACVDILALSPAAAGLFNKVIIGSVVSFNSPLVVIDPLKNAKMFAAKLGFNNTEDINALDKFYTESSLKYLLNTKNHEYYQLKKDTTFYFSPCIENNNNNEEIKIITEPPIEIIKKGNYAQVPMLYAFATMEGLLRKSNFDEWKDEMNEQFHKFLPGNLKFNNKEEEDMIANIVKSFYFEDRPVGNDNILKYTDFFSDSIFISTLFRSIKMHLKADHDKMYLFEYQFVSEDDEIIPHTNMRGAGHCAETYAVLDGTETIFQANETELSAELKKMKVISRKIWANFVKTGSPVPPGSDLPAWPPVSVGSGVSPHMVMTLHPRLEYEWDEQFQRRVRLWDDLYQLYGATPIPPSCSSVLKTPTETTSK